jgi:hypothetical protein
VYYTQIFNIGQVVNICMTIKTIHILDNTINISDDPNYDRLSPENQQYESYWAVAGELIAAGEVSRYCGPNDSVTREADRIIVTTQWATRAGAEKWANWVRNDNQGLISIEIVED